jgi:predicted ATP-dependent protease
VQAVGGVNEKIEGFFRLCEARGLTGEQGAIIPQANVATLMLDEKVLAAVRAGQFHVYAVRQADEALSLLVGEPAGEPNADGEFPEGSINARVVERLRDIAEMISEEDLKEAEKELAQEALAEAKPA